MKLRDVCCCPFCAKMSSSPDHEHDSQDEANDFLETLRGRNERQRGRRANRRGSGRSGPGTGRARPRVQREFVVLRQRDRRVASVPKGNRLSELITGGKVDHIVFTIHDSSDAILALLLAHFVFLRDEDRVSQRYAISHTKFMVLVAFSAFNDFLSLHKCVRISCASEVVMMQHRDKT